MSTGQSGSARTTTRDDSDVVSLHELIQRSRAALHVVWSGRRTVLRCLAVTMPIGVFVAFGSGSEYKATTQLYPYHNASAGGTIARFVGLSDAGGDQLISATLYPVISGTLDYRVALAESPLRFGGSRGRMTSVEYFEKHHREDMVSRLVGTLVDWTIGLPSRMLKLLLPPPPTVSAPADAATDDDPLLRYDLKYRDLIKTASDRVELTVDPLTTVVTITAEMPDPYAAADLARVAAERLKERIIDADVRKATEQVVFVEEQAAIARQNYERTQRALAQFTDRNRGTLSTFQQIEAQRLQSETNLAFETYRQLASQLEAAKINLNRDTPAFTVLQQPVQRSSPRRGVILVLAFLAGLAISGAVLFWRRFSAPSIAYE